MPKEETKKASSIKTDERKLNSVELVETKLLNEEKKKKNYEKSTQVNNIFYFTFQH